MNMINRDPIEQDARYLRMVLVDAFVVAPTWSDMMRIGEALEKLKRIEQEMHAEWLHLSGSGNACGAASMGTAGSQQSMGAESSSAALPVTANAAARQ